VNRWRAIGIALVLIAIPISGMGASSNSHGGKPPVEGPHLYCESQDAENYIVSIDGIDYLIPAEEDSSLWMDLHGFITQVGTYDVTVQPTNATGSANEIYFRVIVVSVKKYLFWKLEPDEILSKTDPDYLPSFSIDLEVTVPKR
jgi:hypothetical protein